MKDIYRVVGDITEMDQEEAAKFVDSQIPKDDVCTDTTFNGRCYVLHLIYSEEEQIIIKDGEFAEGSIKNCDLKDIDTITPVDFDGNILYIADLSDKYIITNSSLLLPK